MNDWQDILAIGLVLAAAGFVLWRCWLTLAARRAAGCGSGCGKCPAAAKPVLQIEPGGAGLQSGTGPRDHNPQA